MALSKWLASGCSEGLPLVAEPQTAGIVFLTLCYDLETTEHMEHKYALMRELAKRHRVVVVTNRASGGNDGGPLLVRSLKAGTLIPRFIEQLALLLVFRLRGFRHFYAHYNFSGAIAGAIVARLTAGRSFSWDCGTPTYRNYWTEQTGLSLKAHIRRVWGVAGLLLSARAVHHLVTGSASMAAYYRTILHVAPGKCLVVPNAVDVTRLPPCDRSQARLELGIGHSNLVILFLHRLWPRKGPQHLVPIVQRLRGLLARPFSMVVVGGGPYLEVLQRDVARAGLEDIFLITGPVPNSRTGIYYSAADVYLMPSEEEGFPHTLLEAMAYGCPFVATNVGGVEDFVSESQKQLVVPPGDVEALACGTAQLASNASLRWALAREGEAWVQRYSIEAAVESFERVVLEARA